MSSYGEVAVRAVHLFTTAIAESPKGAWSSAIADIFRESGSSQKKGCPQNAFLGLCEEGLVKGVPAGKYTRSQKNKKYALDAVVILKQTPEFATDVRSLWNVILKGERKVHNSQMDVVVALWNAGLLVSNV